MLVHKLRRDCINWPRKLMKTAKHFPFWEYAGVFKIFLYLSGELVGGILSYVLFLLNFNYSYVRESSQYAHDCFFVQDLVPQHAFDAVDLSVPLEFSTYGATQSAIFDAEMQEFLSKPIAYNHHQGGVLPGPFAEDPDCLVS